MRIEEGDFPPYLDNGETVQSKASQRRVQAYQGSLPLSVQNHYGSSNLLDVFPTEHEGIWRGEWRTAMCGEHIIDEVFLCISKQFHVRGIENSIFHADSIAKCLAQLAFNTETEGKFERVQELWRSCKEVTRPMVRALGWCDPGINNWVKQNASDIIRSDRIPVTALYLLAQRLANGHYDSYAATLVDLLKNNKHIKESVQ